MSPVWRRLAKRQMNEAPTIVRMGIFDIFRGSRDRRIAQRLITELRALGEGRRMEFDAGRKAVLVFEADGKLSGTWHLGNLRFEIERAPADQHDTIYRRWALSARDTNERA